MSNSTAQTLTAAGFSQRQSAKSSCCGSEQTAITAISVTRCCLPAGEIKFMSTGASPISTEVFEFLRICFGATVSEGYGMTETACTIAMTRPDDATMGHVGAPLDCCEVKLEDIPDMNYKNTDQPYPRGEVSFHAHLRPVAQHVTKCSTPELHKYCKAKTYGLSITIVHEGHDALASTTASVIGL